MGVYGPLRINQPVEIEIKDPEFQGKYRSRVEGIGGDNLTLAAPMKSGEVLSLPRGLEMTVSFYDQVAVYSVDCLLMSFNMGAVPTIVLGSPINSKRIQRRNFVRLDTKIPMTYILLNQGLEPISERFDATTVDISGGGLMFTTNGRVQLGDLMEVQVSTSADRPVTAIGKTVRVTDNFMGKEHKVSVGVEFTIIEEGERDKIIRYIFNRQRELRQRGLL